MDHSFDVFVSYADADRGFARKLAGWLRSAGHRVWMDEEQLVPGSRFRAGLEQGLRESNHLVAVLTERYVDRPWTQREIDLFDLDANHIARRVLAVQVGDPPGGVLDQVFLVHQRIPWDGTGFDPEGLWKLHCGLVGQAPGPHDTWRASGSRIVRQRVTGDAPLESLPTPGYIVNPAHDTVGDELLQSAIDILADVRGRWLRPFSNMRTVIRRLPQHDVASLIMDRWAAGNAEVAAVLALAQIASGDLAGSQFFVWPFVDLGCDEIAASLLTEFALIRPRPSEIWFSWAIAQRRWALLPFAADQAPQEISGHFRYIARAANDATATYVLAEENYEYSHMITPWNHFHLSWLALRLNDIGACSSHIAAICRSAEHGEARTARFLNRLSSWGIFAEVRRWPGIDECIDGARTSCRLPPSQRLPAIRRRLAEIWQEVRTNRDSDGGEHA